MGLGSIVGTGVYVSLGLAVDLAGSAVVLAVALAACVALFNGLSSAQLAAAHPVSGGTYEYGYEYLNHWAGFAAGWLFLVAKSASAATAALGIAAYMGLGVNRLPALILLAAVTGLVLSGLRRTNRVNLGIVVVAVGALVVLVLFALGGAPAAGSDAATGTADLLEASALVFVAFTGYGRIATLGEEVVDPSRTIPRAVVVTLGVTALIYALVALTQSRFDAGSGGSALADIAQEVGGGALATVVRIGAVAALVGVLVNLVLGLSRVVLAMGRRGDLPALFSTVDETGTTPRPAVVAVAVVVGAFVLVGSISTTWSFAAVTVLGYYAITNLSALAQPPGERRFPRLVSWLGLAGCISLAVFLDATIWLWAGGVLGCGLVWHLIRLRRVA